MGRRNFSRRGGALSATGIVVCGRRKRTEQKVQKHFGDFFPRYVAVLSSAEWRDEISEIRIEGHTSSEWEGQTAGDEKYINNAELSQKRSYQVLNYVYYYPP